jgi:hypothetical protein
MEEQFGSCPECGRNDGYRNIYRQHFFFCEEHQITWVPGSNLFSSWRAEGREDWRATWEKLKEYRLYDPDASPAIGPQLGEVVRFESMIPPPAPAVISSAAEFEAGASNDEAQYALECVLARLTEEEMRRVFEDLPLRAREHIRLTAADYPG